MARFPTPHSDPAIDSLIRVADAPLQSVLCTEELARRPRRPPDFEKENVALVALCTALANSPDTILQALADKVLEVVKADSAGLSLLTQDENRFYWAAIAGAWSPHIGGGTPRDFGPCGDVLDYNAALLFTHWERRYPYLRTATPFAHEGLLVPFYVNGTAVGTIWAIAHTKRRNFDAEDLRLLESLGRFASAAYQTVCSNEDLKMQIRGREKAESEIRELEHARAEAALEEREAKARRLIEAALDAVLTIDEEGKIMEWNPSAESMFGWRREDVLGRRMVELVIPEQYRSACERGLRKFLATADGPVLNRLLEITAVRRDGTEFPAELALISYRIGSAWAFSGFIRDISERKRAEASLRRLREVEMELAHANRVESLGQLSASIAHEVNQPIAAAISNANVGLHWLASEPPDPAKVEQALRRIVTNGNRAAEVIDRIRALIKKEPPRIDRLDINEAILEVFALTRSEAIKNGVLVRTHLTEGLPAIQGDRVQLQQVILNLIINAIEAMSAPGSEGPRELQIGTMTNDSDAVLVAIRDSGPGLASLDLERAFEPFYTTKSAGLGMGLSICRSIVEAHGGQLWTMPNEPRGAVFIFTLFAHSKNAS